MKTKTGSKKMGGGVLDGIVLLKIKCLIRGIDELVTVSGNCRFRGLKASNSLLHCHGLKAGASGVVP
jgi:hypothetical protein